jgi:hypothetical protein
LKTLSYKRTGRERELATWEINREEMDQQVAGKSQYRIISGGEGAGAAGHALTCVTL